MFIHIWHNDIYPFLKGTSGPGEYPNLNLYQIMAKSKVPLTQNICPGMIRQKNIVLKSVGEFSGCGYVGPYVCVRI